MPKSVRPRRYSHMNLVLEDYQASLDHFMNVFGAVHILDMERPVWHAYLVDIGGVILEVFVPPAFMLNSRHGAHYLGVEFEADMDDARAACPENGVRIMRDIVEAIHTNPVDGFGVDYEFYGGSFYENKPAYLKTLVAPTAYWRDEHPLGLDYLKGYTQAVSNLEAATRFAQNFLGATVAYTADRPELAARAVGLQIADIVCELLSPTGPGALQDEMTQLGQGIRSTVFRVRDLAQAKAYFAARNIELIPGTAPGSIAIPSAANHGVLFEFAE